MAKKAAVKSGQGGASGDGYGAEVDRILQIWKNAADHGLGGKHFASAVLTRYEPRLRAKVLSRLQSGDTFDAKAEAATKVVATDTGKVCAMLTTGSEVSKDTFQAVFLLMKSHPVCPSRYLGGGTWCDIAL